MSFYGTSPHNRVLNHIALHVPDLETSIEWYNNRFGFRRLRNTVCYDRSTDSCAPIFRVHDSKLDRAKLAFLTAGNDVGFELFQFIDPPISEPSEFSYTRGGIFHLALTDPDPEALLDRGEGGSEANRRHGCTGDIEAEGVRQYAGSVGKCN